MHTVCHGVSYASTLDTYLQEHCTSWTNFKRRPAGRLSPRRRPSIMESSRVILQQVCTSRSRSQIPDPPTLHLCEQHPPAAPAAGVALHLSGGRSVYWTLLPSVCFRFKHFKGETPQIEGPYFVRYTFLPLSLRFRFFFIVTIP